jgi:predicted nucleic acid-binding protein
MIVIVVVSIERMTGATAINRRSGRWSSVIIVVVIAEHVISVIATARRHASSLRGTGRRIEQRLLDEDLLLANTRLITKKRKEGKEKKRE